MARTTIGVKGFRRPLRNGTAGRTNRRRIRRVAKMASVPRWVYRVLYRFSKPAWDRGIVPPELETLVKQDNTRGRALDLGCGTGTNSIYLAEQGFKVTGVDFVPRAVELARGKAARAGAAIDLRVADVTQLDFLHDPFDLALDVGCFHGLSMDARARYVAGLTRLMRPGGRFLLFAFDRPAFPENYGVLPAEVERLFSTGWNLARAQHLTYRNGRPASWYWFVRR